MTLEEMKQKRELDIVQQKRASFSDLVGSPLPVPTSGKRTSFTDIVDFDAGFFDDTPEPATNKFIEDTSDLESSSSSSSSDDDDSDVEDVVKEETKKVVVVKVKVPKNARVGQFVNVRHYDRMYKVAIPRVAIGKKSFKAKIEIDTSDPAEGKNFITGYGLLRQSRVVYKMWKHVYICCTPTTLTIYESERDYRSNTGIVDEFKVHTLCEFGKLYSKEDRASKRHVWQMKILENDQDSNRDEIHDLRLWKMDPRIPIKERMKIGAVDGDRGKKLLEDIRTMLQERLKKMQQVALAKTCVRDM